LFPNLILSTICRNSFIQHLVFQNKSYESVVSLKKLNLIESEKKEEQQESHQTKISFQSTTRSNSKTAKKNGVFKTERISLKEFSSWIQEVKGDSFRKPF
jgi:hypothetical protein